MGLPLIALLGSIASEFITDWRESRQQKRQLKQAANEFQQQQARSAEEYTRQWELQALLNNGVWMRRGTLILFSLPLPWAYIDPDGVQAYFQVLEQMPDWYLQAYGGMIAAVWGLSELRQWRAGKAARKQHVTE